MHPSVMEWVGDKVENLDLATKSTLECGSRNYNGSVRRFFRGDYVGIDMEEGRDVDLVASSHHIPFSKDRFDVVVCTEMLEHDDAFWLSFPEFNRVLKPGGHLLLTTRGIGFPYHEYPGDYWRFTDDALQLLCDREWLKVIQLAPDPYPDHPGWFLHAQKPLWNDGVNQ